MALLGRSLESVFFLGLSLESVVFLGVYIRTGVVSLQACSVQYSRNKRAAGGLRDRDPSRVARLLRAARGAVHPGDGDVADEDLVRLRHDRHQQRHLRLPHRRERALRPVRPAGLWVWKGEGRRETHPLNK